LDENLTSRWPELKEVEICAKLNFSLDPWELELCTQRVLWKLELKALFTGWRGVIK